MPNVPNSAPWMDFGRNYANEQASVFDPAIASARARLASFLTPEQIASNVSGLFDPARQDAANLGTNVSNVGADFAGAMAGLGSVLPGMDSTSVTNALRSTGRAGASASIMGSLLSSQANQQAGLSTLEQQARLAQDKKDAQDKIDSLELQQNTIRSDWLTPASHRQDMANTAVTIQGNRLNNQQIRAQLSQIPIQNRAASLANMVTRGQIDAQILNNLSAMRSLGLSQADIVRARKLYGGVTAGGAGGHSGSSGGHHHTPSAASTSPNID
jgi:hypothetical protein